MKHVNSFTKYLFWAFAVISFIGVLTLCSINDIGPKGLRGYIIYAGIVVACVVTSIFLFNYRIVFRHLFAIHKFITLVYITYFKIRSRRYNYLYDAALKTKSVPKFYNAMLRLYDIANEGVVTVSDLYN